MKVANLKKIFKDFYSNNDRAILIDGSWGIGKTHAILDFLEWTTYTDSGIPDNTIYKYVSLFGKESIDEIHTEIYKQFHPHYYRARSVINLVPKVASLGNFIPGTTGSVANTISSLQYTLKVTQNSSVKNKNIKHQVLFLDDLERVDFNKISFNEILGYFDNLIRQGIKIVTVCCSEMLLKRYPQLENDFIGFKEKVFDREYKITATERETMLSYFDEDSQIDDNIIAEFNNNLRIAQRTSSFYNEIKTLLKKMKINNSEIYSDKELLEYCAYVIVETHTDRYKSYNEDTSGDSVFNSHIFYMEHEDKNIEEEFKHIYYYKKKTVGYNCIDSKLLNALLQFYFYRDEDKLFSIFKINATDNIFYKNIMLLSDEGKLNIFSEQIKYILDGKELNNLNLIDVITSWFIYSEFSNILNEEDKVIDALIRNEKEYEKQINYLTKTYNISGSNDFDKFVSKLENKLNENRLNKLLSDMGNYWKRKEYSKLYNEIYRIAEDNIYFTDCTRMTLKPIVANFVKQNNYFIEDLSGEIDYHQWNIAFEIVKYAKKCGFKDELMSYIDNLKIVDRSSEMRYQMLLNHL